MRDFLTQNTDPPTANFPFGKSRDTGGGSDGTWISSEVWGDLIHGIHKIMDFSDESPDGTIDSQANDLGQRNNQQFTDGIMKFILAIFLDKWKTRLNESVTDILRVRDFRTVQNDQDLRISFAYPDFNVKNIPFSYFGYAGDQNFLYFITFDDPLVAVFSKYDSELNLIDSFSAMSGELDPSTLQVVDNAFARDRTVYLDTTTGQIFDFSFVDNSYQNAYLNNAPYFADRVLVEGGYVYAHDFTAGEMIIFSGWSRREVYRFSVNAFPASQTLGFCVYDQSIYIIKRRNQRLNFVVYTWNTNGTISPGNPRDTGIPIQATPATGRVFNDYFHVVCKLTNGDDVYLILLRPNIGITSLGFLLYRDVLSGSTNYALNNITVYDSKLLIGSGSNILESELKFNGTQTFGNSDSFF